jgi:CBS domain-containing protein
MRVDEVMTPAKCCSPEDTVQRCARLMKDENIGFVPVCERDGKPMGAVTDRDLAVRVLAEGKDGKEQLRNVLTRDIVHVRLGADVAEAARLMRERQVSRVMVCDDAGKLQGVISLQDLAEAESDEETGRTLTDVKSDQSTAHH